MQIIKLHTLIVGSGAAGLNAALQLHRAGNNDIALVTEGLNMGTSINTGSDKQTYYKLSLYGDDYDSPQALAESFFSGGAVHGDVALVEAACSTRAFMNLVDLGVSFPRDRYGQFIGYKTDHDPLRRATSCGPYTSRDICLALIAELRQRQIRVFEERQVVRLLTQMDAGVMRIVGALAVYQRNSGELIWECYQAENLIFAVGGPGGLYQRSVYPAVHTGAIGLGLEIGARARNLAESQFGLASVKFRWNVSGSYMQVVPRIFSTAADGSGDECEFLDEFEDSPGNMASLIFLKGYQWPFDAGKAVGGSSLIDILVYRETVLKGRRVWLDFRRNGSRFSFDRLSTEAAEYLRQSGATQATPIERLRQINPAAVKLYEEHAIHLAVEPLEIAVCAQHNNGGLSGNIWWESENIGHFFPIGEVNGSHGICRPGGAALNAGQVGALRAAEYIAAKYPVSTLDASEVKEIAAEHYMLLQDWLERCRTASWHWQEVRQRITSRMSRYAALIRRGDELDDAVAAAWQDYHCLLEQGCRFNDIAGVLETLRNRHLVLAHACYLDAVRATVAAGAGSRGSALVLAATGHKLHVKLGDDWRMQPEDDSRRSLILTTEYRSEVGGCEHSWEACRPLPAADGWFENLWADYGEGKIYE